MWVQFIYYLYLEEGKGVEIRGMVLFGVFLWVFYFVKLGVSRVYLGVEVIFRIRVFVL